MERSDVETRTASSSNRHLAPGDGRPTTACCIAGMHRSGTSMVARLLHACGVFLGPADELREAMPYNPEGNFENPRFVKLNEDILTQFGGRWNEPPSFPMGWEFTPEVNSLLERAENLIGQSRRDNWGWKDPRNSLTLPFWQRLIPDLKVVVCVRSPLEVARSLFVRGDSTSQSQSQLWLTYYRQLLTATLPTHHLVTHYRSYFQDPRAELRRVLDWLDTDVSDETVERACSHISAGLRHHVVSTMELAELIGEADVPDEVLSLYFSLCAAAGPIYQQSRKHGLPGELENTAGRANEVSVLMNELQQLRADGAAREQTYTACERTLDEILNSKSYRLVSLYWRLRRRK